jgi:hypothetical protein
MKDAAQNIPAQSEQLVGIKVIYMGVIMFFSTFLSLYKAALTALKIFC